MGPIFTLLTAPIALGVGAIVGGSKGLSDEKMKEVTAAEASIRAANTDLKIHDNFRDYFLETVEGRLPFRSSVLTQKAQFLLRKRSAIVPSLAKESIAFSK